VNESEDGKRRHSTSCPCVAGNGNVKSRAANYADLITKADRHRPRCKGKGWRAEITHGGHLEIMAPLTVDLTKIVFVIIAADQAMVLAEFIAESFSEPVAAGMLPPAKGKATTRP